MLLEPEEHYELLRKFTSPVVAITSRNGDDVNGMIANSFVRASLVPDIPRLAFYCFKQHHSHGLITETGQFCAHLLDRDQLPVVRALGFDSGADHDKLSRVDWHINEHGLPVIDNSYAWMSCEVINATDAGSSTFFLGEIVASGRGTDPEESAIMDSGWFHENMPEEWVPLYEENKQEVQDWAREHSDVDPSQTWEPPNDVNHSD